MKQTMSSSSIDRMVAHRRHRLGALQGTLLLGMIVLLPATVFYMDIASSLALGASISAVVLCITALSYRSEPNTLARQGALVVTLCLCLVTHVIVAGLYLPVDFGRALSSLIPLGLLLLSGCGLARILATSRPETIDRVLKRLLALLILLAILSALGISFPALGGGRPYTKPVFPFTEPSHFALYFTPLLMYACVTSTGPRRLATLAVGLGVALLLQNLTLIVGLCLAGSVSLRRWVFPLIIAVIGFVAMQLDFSYYAERLDFSGEVQNLSNLVYVQGWQLMSESLTRSAGWGLGFQQLGIQGTSTPASDIIYALTGEFVNILDGGFTLSKVVSEFGIFGLGLIAIYLVAAWNAWRSLRLASRRPGSLHALDVFACSVIVGYIVELLIRGTGYFSGTAILLTAALWLRHSRRGLRISHQPALAGASRVRRVRSVIRRPAPTAATSALLAPPATLP